jgi:ATP-binding cassette subfamily A (ABC1) protein 1
MVDRWILKAPVAAARLDPKFLFATANTVISMCLAPTPVYAASGGALKAALDALKNLNTTASRAAFDSISAELGNWLGEMRFAPQSVDFTPFPFFGFNQNGFYGIALSILSFFLVIAYVFPVSRLIRGIVLEKEVKMREGMKMMGLGDAALFGSWMAFYGIFWAVLSLIIALISHVPLGSGGNIFAASDGGKVWIMFFLFGCSCSTFAYLISIFFSQSKTASSIGIVVFIASFFPVFTVSDGAVSTTDKILACLLSPTAFGLTINVAGLLEQNGAGVTADTASAVINNFSFNYGCGMMVADTILYAVLGWYIDAVLPARFREFGVPRPFNFPFTAAYWREVRGLPARASGTSVVNNAGPGAASRDSGPDPSFIEQPDASLLAKEREGRFVGVSKLRKEFSTPDGVKVAVDGIDMHMYEGQIFVLLGHNGAGKTTTISMLTGLIEPTSGGMSIFGRDVSTQLSEVRHDLGVCPQHNVLWPELTVREHLQVFSEIKGVPRERRNIEIDKAVADVGLTEKMDVLSSQLSGGQKRKLSVCIALVGGSRVIFLDEPTSGMDPYSRRSTWQILQNAREGRVMVLTTHFMDEADILGDRICIMANGGVKCMGSSSFLKERFGVGYILTLIKAPGLHVESILKLLRAHVPEASVATNVGAELNLRLPMTSSPRFPAMLAELDQRLAEVGVLSYGISITSVEDVFLKISGGEHFGSEADVGAAVAAKTPDWSAPVWRRKVCRPVCSARAAARTACSASASDFAATLRTGRGSEPALTSTAAASPHCGTAASRTASPSPKCSPPLILRKTSSTLVMETP